MKEGILPAFDFFENMECRYTLGLKNSSRDYSHQNQPLDFESMGNEEEGNVDSSKINQLLHFVQ